MIILNMICKNEAHVIKRALFSADRFVDHMVIVDTGSTDGTQQIVRAHPNTTLYERPWVNFGFNRQEALELAEQWTAENAPTENVYYLFLDCDDTLEATPDFKWPELVLPGYTLPIQYSDTSYTRCALIKSKAGWKWTAVLHEYLTADTFLEQGALSQPVIKIIGGGARSLDPTTYIKDVLVLEKALAAEPNNARYTFYLAQSYKDSRQLEKAFETYDKRTKMEGWDQERWYAMYQKAIIAEWLQNDPTKYYLTAYQTRPTRLEPLYQLAKYHRLRGEHALGYMYSKHGVGIALPDDTLFVDKTIYVWRILEEFALNAYYVGEKEVGASIIRSLIARGNGNEEDQERFAKNLEWYK